MYGHNNNNNEFSYAYSSADFLAHFDVPSNFPLAPLPPPPLVIPGNDFESVTAAVKLDFGYATSSGCSSYGSPSSLASYGTQTSELMMQRSVSSHSLHKHVNGFQQLVSSPTEFLDSDTSPVRKVFSTGDLQVTLQQQKKKIRKKKLLYSLHVIRVIISSAILMYKFENTYMVQFSHNFFYPTIFIVII